MVGDCHSESNGLLTRGVANTILEGEYDAQNERNDGYGVGNLSLLHGLEGLRELTSSKNLGNNCRALMEYLQIRWLFCASIVRSVILSLLLNCSTECCVLGCLWWDVTASRQCDRQVH
jgi:hypothetical protein